MKATEKAELPDVPPIPASPLSVRGHFCGFGYHGGTAMKPDYNRIPRDTLKTLQRWIATGRHIDDDNEADAFCLAVLMK
jgi:hypothetical protein